MTCRTLPGMLALILAAIVQLPSGVHFIPGSSVPGSQPDGNSIVFDAPDGLIVVDTGRHREHTQKILDFAQLSGRAIRAIINTHWHLDHISGNKIIRDAYPDVRVFASGALHDARSGFLSNYRKQLEDVIPTTTNADERQSHRDEIVRIDSGPSLEPTDVVTQSGTRTIAGRKLRLEVDRDAVTAADVWVFDPKSRVLAAGDLVTLPVPFLDTACPSGWSAELSHIAKARFDVLIPGHGQPMDRDAFATYERAFDRLLSCAKSDAAKTSCIDGWVSGTHSLQPDADERFTRSLMNYYVDLLRDPRRIAKACGH